MDGMAIMISSGRDFRQRQQWRAQRGGVRQEPPEGKTARGFHIERCTSKGASASERIRASATAFPPGGRDESRSRTPTTSRKPSEEWIRSCAAARGVEVPASTGSSDNRARPEEPAAHCGPARQASNHFLRLHARLLSDTRETRGRLPAGLPRVPRPQTGEFLPGSRLSSRPTGTQRSGFHGHFHGLQMRTYAPIFSETRGVCQPDFPRNAVIPVRPSASSLYVRCAPCGGKSLTSPSSPLRMSRRADAPIS